MTAVFGLTPSSSAALWGSLFFEPPQSDVEALMLGDHCVQLIENAVHRPFETQNDRGQYAQIIAHRILFGNHAFQLLADKFKGDPLLAHKASMAAAGCGVNRKPWRSSDVAKMLGAFVRKAIHCP